MNLQGNVNQLLGTIGTAAGIYATYGAVKGIRSDLAGVKSAGEKQLSGSTLERVKEFNKTPNRVNTPASKAAASQFAKPPVQKIMDARKRLEAMENTKSQAKDSIDQIAEFGSLRDQILHPKRYMEGGNK